MLNVKIHHYDRLDSTQTKAQRLAERGAPEGTIILANTQTAGRGRWGRTWISPRGGLWASIVLRPKIPAHRIPLLGLVMALSVSRALAKCFRLKAAIRWPNDVIVRERKIAGILVETSLDGERIDHITLGLGVNVNNSPSRFPRTLRKTVTSASLELQKPVARKPLLEAIVHEFDKLYYEFTTGDVQRLLQQVRGNTATLGRHVRVRQKGLTCEGEALDLNSAGGLVLKTANGSTRCFYVGDVLHVEQR